MPGKSINFSGGAGITKRDAVRNHLQRKEKELKYSM
jgi:hypothetical protein